MGQKVTLEIVNDHARKLTEQIANSVLEYLTFLSQKQQSDWKKKLEDIIKNKKIFSLILE